MVEKWEEITQQWLILIFAIDKGLNGGSPPPGTCPSHSKVLASGTFFRVIVMNLLALRLFCVKSTAVKLCYIYCTVYHTTIDLFIYAAS